MYDSTSQRIDAFQDLICQLPTVHQHLLLYVLDMLRLFATHASVTRMDASNLAAVFAPGLLNHPQHNSPVHYMISQRVIEFLIEYQNLFTMDLLVDQPSKLVEPDEALVSPNILARSSPIVASPESIVPSVPAIPARWIPPSPPLPTHTVTSSPDTTYQNDDMDIPTPRPSSPVQSKQSPWIGIRRYLERGKGKSLVLAHPRLTGVPFFFFLDFWNPFLFLWYFILTTLITTFGYEGYLLCAKVALIEPVLFFTGFLGYGLLMVLGTDTTTPTLTNHSSETNTASSSPIEKYYIYGNEEDGDDDDFDKCSVEEDGLSLFDDISVSTVLQDKEVMANWQHLISRSWRAAPDDDDRAAYPPLGRDNDADDVASMMSVTSRFNEAESEDDDGDDDDTDELASTTDEDLQRLWERYEQLKQPDVPLV